MLERTLSFMLLGLCAASVLASNPPLAYRPIAATGQPAPGLGPGVEFDNVNSAGSWAGEDRFIFMSTLRGEGITSLNNQSIWLLHNNTVALIAQTGDAAPGTEAGVVFSTFSTTHKTNQMGELLIRCVLDGPGVDESNNVGVWHWQAGSLTKIIRSGDQAPGFQGDATIADIKFGLGLNDAGHVQFTGQITGMGISSSNDYVIWSGLPESIRIVVREGDLTPIPGLHFSVSTSSMALLSENSTCLFSATLTGPGVSLSNDKSVWQETSEGFTLVARDGNSMPGVSPNQVLETIFRGNNHGPNGETAIYGVLSGPGLTPESRYALWRYRDSTLALIARGGQSVSTPIGTTIFTSTSSFPFVDPSESMVFLAGLRDPDDASSSLGSIWRSNGESIRLLGMEGQQAPGFADGVVFTDFYQPIMTDNGVNILVNDVAGPGFAGDVTGVWLTKGDEPLRLVAFEGMIVDLSPDQNGNDARTVSYLAYGRVSIGRERRIVLPVDFSDGTSALLGGAVSPGCAVDFAHPAGSLDFFDVSSFLTLFAAADSEADLAPPSDVFNFFDISEFLTLFAQGCP